MSHFRKANRIHERKAESPSPAPPEIGWCLLLPLKPLTLAKSRLADSTGDLRPGLALAFAQDTVAAALACPAVARVTVITDDRRAREALVALGAAVVPDYPARGLNAALEYGEAQVRAFCPHTPVAALSADLPALRPSELGRLLNAATGPGRTFLADAAGMGTTLLTAGPGASLRPRFEGASRLRHAASGARELTLGGVDSVRRDVDTGEDLRAAVLLGVGPRTASALGGHGWGLGDQPHRARGPHRTA